MDDGLFCVLSLPSEVVMDCCAGSFSAAKAFTLHLQYKQLVGFDLDSQCFASSLSQLALIFAHRIFMEKHNTTWDDNVHQTASTIVEAMDELNLERQINVWDTPEGFSIMQTFPLHSVYHLSTYHMHYDIYDLAKNIPANLWTLRWRSRLEMFDVRYFLAVDCVACGVKIKARSIHHESIGCGVF